MQHQNKFAWTVKIGEKGQFVIPKQARQMFDIHPGDTIILLADSEKGIAIPPKEMFTQLAAMIFEGQLEGKGESIDE